jgi:hypothetical protein
MHLKKITINSKMCWVTNPNLISRLILMHNLILRYCFHLCKLFLWHTSKLQLCKANNHPPPPPPPLFSFSFFVHCIGVCINFFPFFSWIPCHPWECIMIVQGFFLFCLVQHTCASWLCKGVKHVFFHKKGLILFSTHWVSGGWLWKVCVCVCARLLITT